MALIGGPSESLRTASAVPIYTQFVYGPLSKLELPPNGRLVGAAVKACRSLPLLRREVFSPYYGIVLLDGIAPRSGSARVSREGVGSVRGPVADDFDVVAVGVQDECGEVVLVVVRAWPRGPVVLTACCDSRRIERAHRGAIFGVEGNVHGSDCLSLADPEVGSTLSVLEARPPLAFEAERVAKRLQRRFIELFRRVDVRDTDDYVIDHGRSLTTMRRRVKPPELENGYPSFEG